MSAGSAFASGVRAGQNIWNQAVNNAMAGKRMDMLRTQFKFEQRQRKQTLDNQVSSGAASEFADNVFRVKDNSDASKKLAFECSGISGSTTRTMTVPNTDGTISTESFATAIAVALG